MVGCRRRAEPFDVVVVGGGLAGVCAALAAARHGARTALVHNRPVLGGNSSTEIRVPPAGAGYNTPYASETGIVLELVLEDRARNHDPVGTGMANGVWDLVLYEAVRRQPGLSLFLNTQITAAVRRGNRVRSVSGEQMGSEIHWEIPGRFFIDASGDGVVGAAVGVPYRIGQEAAAEYGESLAPAAPWTHTLGSSLHFRARDTGRPAPFEPPCWAQPYVSEASLAFRPHGSFAGGYWWIEIGWPYNTIADNEALRDELLRHVLGIWDHLKNHCPQTRDLARNYALDWVGMLPGKRESRRFVGAHVLTQNDLQQRPAFPDVVGAGGWGIDDHTREGILDPGKAPSFDKASYYDFFVLPYGVPLRSLYAASPRNLFFAGRVLSASRLAFNSLRVMLTLAQLGQAAGTAAAYCVRRRTLPGRLTARQIGQVQQELIRDDVHVPGVANRDPDDLARGAAVSASSSAPFDAVAGAGGLSLNEPLAQVLPVGPAGVTAVSAFVAATAPCELRGALVPAATVWDLGALERRPGTAVALRGTCAAGGQWVRFALDGRAVPEGYAWLALEPVAGVSWRYSEGMIPGCAAARLHAGRWWFAPGPFGEWHTFAVRVEPDPQAYGPGMALSGMTRPGARSELWRSDPAQALPQWLMLDLGEAHAVATAVLIFDTNLARINRVMPPFHHAPECVRDYRLQAETTAGEWTDVVRVTGNYQRRREHRFVPVTARRWRLLVEATNGVPEARLYEVRLYA